jgi:hypothetical protein
LKGGRGVNQKIRKIFLLFIGMPLLISCGDGMKGKIQLIDRSPDIFPDYSDVTIPSNIAPMNFFIKEKGSSFRIIVSAENGAYQMTVKSSQGDVQFPEKQWKKLTATSKGDRIKFEVYVRENESKQWEQYEPFYMDVADEPVDPYLVYRLIYPGYYSWSHIRIMQRSVESFREESMVDNQILDMNCINCHSFNQYNPNRFLVHIRGSRGGTYFAEDGKLVKRDLKIDAMPGSATYPAWHPGGRYVAFSSNQVRQNFYSVPSKNIEVFDLVSSLIVYDLKNNDIVLVTDSDTTRYHKTFPSWSPDGLYLYFCRALQANTENSITLEAIKQTKYNIVRIPFDPESGTFGESEVVFNAAELGKSASFPRISPDGNYMVVTVADYGTFPIWHKEADLYIVDLRNGVSKKMELNSEDTESYHTWSSNGKWLVFSSKRIEGRSARPFIAYFKDWDHTGKPFVLPQKDPKHYQTMIESFNIPEFVKGKIRFNPRDFERVSLGDPVKAVSGNPADSLPEWEIQKAEIKRNPGERPIHE